MEFSRGCCKMTGLFVPEWTQPIVQPNRKGLDHTPATTRGSKNSRVFISPLVCQQSNSSQKRNRNEAVRRHRNSEVDLDQRNIQHNDASSSMDDPKEPQGMSTGVPVPNSTGDPTNDTMAPSVDQPATAPMMVGGHNHGNVVMMEKTPDNNTEMPTDLAGLAAVVAGPARSPGIVVINNSNSDKREDEEPNLTIAAATQGLTMHMASSQGGSESTNSNNGSLPMPNAMDMTTAQDNAPPPSETTTTMHHHALATPANNGGTLVPNNNNNHASPTMLMTTTKNSTPMSTNDEEEEEDDDDDDEDVEDDDDRMQENSRRPDNEWQPPKKRRRKPEPMKPFNDMLYELLVFRAREGHCRVPLDTKSALGRWVANLRTQRSNLRKGYHSLDLTQERLEVLDSVGFVWDLQQFDSDSRWKRQYEELAAFSKSLDTAVLWR